MSLKECLAQLCDIRLEIKDIEKKIEKLEPRCQETISDSVESTSKQFPIIRTRMRIFGNDKKLIEKMEQYKNILEERHAKLMNIEIETVEFIDKLPTSRLRRIFTYRYIDQHSWVKVASLIGGNTTEDSVRKEHDRFLKKNELCPICPEKL